MFLDGPNFGTAFRRIFDLYDSLDEDDRSDLYPIMEMIGMACCAADTSDMAPSSLSTQWTRLTYHARMKRWATDAWAKHSEPVEQEHSDQDEPLSLAEWAPLAHLNNLCGQRQKRQPREPTRPAMEHDSCFIPAPHGQPAKAGMEGGDLGSIMVKILEAQAEASLCLHRNLLENFWATSAAVGATGTTRDARLSDAKLRILQACAGGVITGHSSRPSSTLKPTRKGDLQKHSAGSSAASWSQYQAVPISAMCISRRRLYWRQRC